MTAPTLPGSPTPWRYTDRSPPGSDQRRLYTPTTRVPDPSELTSASSSGSTSSPATRKISGSQPAASAASTRSSPSATNRSSRSRQLLSRSLRMVLSCWLSWEVIKGTKKAPPWAPREFFRCDSRSGGRTLPGLVGKTSERLGVAHGYVGQHLAVEFDAGQLQAVHELAVAQALLAGGGVDARDPEAAEVALLVAPVAVGVLVGLEQGLLGELVARVSLAPVALGPVQRGAPLLARVYGTFDAAHLCSSSLTRFSSGFATITGRPSRRLRLGRFWPVLWVSIACRARSLPLAVLRKRFLAPEWVFILGMSALLKQTPCLTRQGRRRSV